MTGKTISHYVLGRLLGAGGMGEVFLARDLALGRAAAVKVLSGAVREDLRLRLLREAGAASRLQHPGIATFFEAGEHDGITFVAMEYVEGETLRNVLGRGPLPRERALRVGIDLLEALNHAHAAGVVHRDIKPENVMMTPGGGAKLLDFGLAVHHAGEGAPDPDSDTPTRTVLTERGAILGSPGYMAPEQLTGAPVGPPTDLFAMGALLYECLSGRRAFPGATAHARFAATLTADPPPLDADAADLEPIVRKALSRDVGARYGSAAGFLRDLRSAARGELVGSFPDSLAVFDLHNRTGRADDDWIGSGIADSLSADLARFEGLTVAPRAKVARQGTPGADFDPLLAARRVGCRWAISGSFQKAGEALRVVVELADASTERVVASEKLDGTAQELFSIQDRLARRVAAALNVRERPEGKGSGRDGVVGAFESLTRAKRLWLRMSKGTFDEAQELLEDALRQQPDYADALAQLAGVHDMRFTFTTDVEELRRAEACARRAIAVSPEHADAHVWLAYSLWRQERSQEALEALHTAGALAPDNGYPPYFSACIVHHLGRPQEAVARFQRAVSLMPQFGFAWVGLGHAHTESGNFQEAVWTYEKGIELEKSGYHATAGAEGYLGECLRREGRLDEARSRCLAGLESVDRTDHMYRDSFRAFCLVALGRVALDQKDAAGARAAFLQCALHLRGRPRTLGGGALACQAMAGMALADGDPAALAEAVRRFRGGGGGNWTWIFGASRRETESVLREVAAALGRPDLVDGL